MKKIISLIAAIMLLAAIVAGCSTTVTNQKELSCTITIDAAMAKQAGYTAAGEDGIILKETTVKIREGETAFDVLSDIAKQKNFPVVKAEMSGFVYITGINSLSAGDLGAMSGWMYSVNGEYIQVSCSEYKVQEGDKLVFIYTYDGGADIGAW